MIFYCKKERRSGKIQLRIYSLLLVIFLPGLLLAQGVDDAEDDQLGLVLSGGGAKGFAHIGVLKVLEEVGMPVDMITGTSMGAIIGGLYAMGYSAAELEEIALHVDWQALFADETKRRHIPIEEKLWDGRFLVSLPIKNGGVSLPSELVYGHQVRLLLSRLTWPFHDVDDFSNLPIPFACVATDLETGDPVVLNSGDLAKAMQASSAIPSIFAPVEIDGRVLVDGGLLRNLPVQDVIDMGASFTLAVNASTQLLEADRLIGMADMLTQTINLQMLVNMKIEEEKSDLLIHPDLGIYNLMDFDQARSIIQLGEDAAREHIDSLRELADSLNRNRNSGRTRKWENRETINIRGVTFKGLEQLTEEQALEQMILPPSGTISFEEIEEGIARLYGMQIFNRVSYRVQSQGGDYHLVIEVFEEVRDLFRFGFRYDSWTRASLLLNATFRNVPHHNSVLRLNTRFGEQLELDAQYFSYFGHSPKLATGLNANFTRYSIDLYEENNRTANINTDALSAELFLGAMFSSLAMGGGSIKQEIFNPSTRIGPQRMAEGWTGFTSLSGTFWLETYDRSVFPTQGNSLRIRSEFTLPFTDVLFTRHEFEWGAHYPITNRLNLQSTAYLGQAYGPDLPFHHQYFLGGYPRFSGYHLYELTGSSVASLRGNLRYEVMDQRYLMFGVNAGDAYDRLTFPPDRVRVGWDVTVASETILGPVSLSLMGSARHPVLLEFHAGFRF